MPFRRLQWLLPFAVTIHNAEEALTYNDFLIRHSKELPWSLDHCTFISAAVLLAGAVWLLTYHSWSRGSQSLPAYLVFGFIVATLANVPITHLPLAIRFQAYNPGLISAVAINLPAMTLLLLRCLRERYVTGKRAAAFAALVPLGIAAATVVVLLISRRIT